MKVLFKLLLNILNHLLEPSLPEMVSTNQLFTYLQSETELSNLLGWNWHNNIVHPLGLIVSAGGEVRLRTIEKACCDYENKFIKAETDAKKHAKVYQFPYLSTFAFFNYICNINNIR